MNIIWYFYFFGDNNWIQLMKSLVEVVL